MAEVFNISGESDGSVVAPSPQLQGLFVAGIDNPFASDGLGIVTPWGGGSTARRYGDYGISTEISSQNTQLYDLASSFVPTGGAGMVVNIEGLIGPQGIPGKDGITTIIHDGGNSNFLTTLPHNLDLINDLGTAVDQMIYTDSFESHYDAGIATWTERQPAGATTKYWRCAASDSDGSHLIAAIYGSGGRLYTSADYGATWTERQPAGDADKNWIYVASDADGSHLIAAINNGRLYTSANYGVTWTERQPGGAANKAWYGVASDADGSHLVAHQSPGGRLYTSADYGVNWVERQPAGATTKNWYCSASDDDGSHLIAGIYGYKLYTSSDYGVNWVERQPAGATTKNWSRVASDSDGSHLVACVYGGRLYTSADYGSTWIERRPTGDANQYWQGLSSDSDGSHLVAHIWDGKMYMSEDYGVTWAEAPQIDGEDKNWYIADLNSEGSYAIAATGEYKLFTGAGDLLYGEATWAETTITSAGRALLDDLTAAAMATTLGLGTGDSPTFTGLTLSSIAHEATDVDKFLCDSTGVIKYRTGAEILSDVGGQPLDAGLTSLAGLTYASDSFIKVTAEDTYAIRTIAETKADLNIVIGTDVQAWDAGLDSLAALGYVSDSMIKITAEDTYAIRTLAEVKTDLGLSTADSPTFAGLNLSADGATLILKNSVDENGANQAETIIKFRDHADNDLAQIRADHVGAGDDCLGNLRFYTNNGSGLIEAFSVDQLKNFIVLGGLAITSGATVANFLSAGGAATGQHYGSVANTGGDFRWGVERSAGASLFVGTSAYSGVIGCQHNTALHLCTNNAVKVTITDTTITLGGNLVIPDGGTIGSASDVDIMTLDADGDCHFSVFPITPSAAPDADYEVANKKYVDDNIGGGGVSTWIDLTDTDPANYAGQAGNSVVVNAGEDGLEFGAAPGGAFTSKCSVYRNGAQAIATGTFTKVALDTEDYDTDGEFDSTTNYRFEPSSTGYYHVSAVVEIDTLGDGKWGVIGIYKNGALWKSAAVINGAAVTCRVPISLDIYLLNTDYIELFIYHNAGANRNTGTTVRHTFMDIHRFA